MKFFLTLMLVATVVISTATPASGFFVKARRMGIMVNGCQLICRRDPDLTIYNNGDMDVPVMVAGKRLLLKRHSMMEIAL